MSQTENEKATHHPTQHESTRLRQAVLLSSPADVGSVHVIGCIPHRRRVELLDSFAEEQFPSSLEISPIKSYSFVILIMYFAA